MMGVVVAVVGILTVVLFLRCFVAVVADGVHTLGG